MTTYLDHEALAGLRTKWEREYKISGRNDRWKARHRGETGLLDEKAVLPHDWDDTDDKASDLITAETAEELHQALVADYCSRAGKLRDKDDPRYTPEPSLQNVSAG
jgi:hypothetical protein